MAALRDDTKLVLYMGAAARPDIQLFSAAGSPLGRVLWEPRARVAAAGWTSEEQLLVLDDAAQVGRRLGVDRAASSAWVCRVWGLSGCCCPSAGWCAAC